MPETAETPPTARQWLGLVAVALGVALIVVDLTIVNVILAPIIEDLSIGSSEAQWIQESYAITFAALLLVTGRLSDLYGARRIFLLGLAVFGVTSLLAASAPGGGPLILARFVQGVGGAMMLPTSLALLNATFTGRARGQAFAVWGSTIGAAAAVGPLLGGWLADLSWRWAFGINIPLVALIVVGVLLHLDASPRTPGRIDGVGAALSAAGLGLLAFVLIEGRAYGWLLTTEPLEIGGFSWSGGLSPVFVALLLSVLALGVFWRRQTALSRAGDEPLMDVGLFSIRSFRNGNFVTLMVGLGEFGIIAVLPLWLQFALGYSAFEAGLALVALAMQLRRLRCELPDGRDRARARPGPHRPGAGGRRADDAGPDRVHGQLLVAHRPRVVRVRDRRRLRHGAGHQHRPRGRAGAERRPGLGHPERGP